MAILITGAMGHIGQEVVRQACAAGDQVVAQYRDTFRVEEAAALGENVTWIPCDLTDRAAVEELCTNHDIDACIHLAAVSNEAYARPDPLAAVRANVGAVASLLDIARRRDWKRFILVSTGSVFQNLSDVKSPIFEDTPPSVVNIYGTTKLCAELTTQMYRTQFGLSAASVRISWVFGPPVVSVDPPRGPIPAFLKWALEGTSVREPSGADFEASFTYVGDVAAGLLAAYRAPKLNHDVYHLGPGVNFTTGQVATAICAAVPGAVIELGPGTEPWTTYTAPRGPLAGDRFEKDIGYTIANSLESGIQLYADWMRAHPETYG